MRALRDQLIESGTTTLSSEDFVLSMGTSSDFAMAIEEGATEVRLGTTIFGARTYA